MDQALAVDEREDGDVQGKGVKFMMEKPTEMADCANGRSQTLDQQLGSLHGTSLGPLHVSDSCVPWSVRGAPGSGTKIYP